MESHWTEKRTEDYQFKIAADFVSQLEAKMEAEHITQDKLAELTGLTKGRVSQVINNPGNMTIGNIIKFARAVGLKVSLLAYDDNDPGNHRGPINSEVFRICWENSGKPSDLWAFQESGQMMRTANSVMDSPGRYLYLDTFDKIDILKTAAIEDVNFRTPDKLTAVM